MANKLVLFTCKCGTEEWIKPQALGQKKRCLECAKEKQRQWSRENNARAKKAALTGPKCSCGCGRTRGEGRTFLSDYCWRRK